jgi:PAS domain S-box-containing protein
VPGFLVLAAGQVCAGVMHRRRSQNQSNLGVRLVAISFVVWGVHSAAFAFIPGGFEVTAVRFITTSLLALVVAIGLIVEIVINRSEMAVTQSQMNYREILEAINDGIFIVDLRTLRVLDANRAAGELTKRDTKELLGCKFSELCPNLEDCDDSKSDPRKAFSAVFKPFRHFYIVRADGSTLTCEGEAKYVEWQNKSVMQVQVRQVADRGRVGELVRRADKMSALGQLIAGVAHELNNPLAVILGRTQILAKRASDTDREELLKILHESERAAKIVRDLLTFTRPCDPQFVVVDLNRLVGNVLDVFAPELTGNKIHLEKQLAPSLPLTKGDSIQLEQVLTNLVKNAVYAMSAQPSARKLIA